MAQSYGPRHHDDRGGRYEQDRGGRWDHDRGGGWQNISQRKFNLDRRIDRGERNGSLSRREANRLRRELDDLVYLERSFLRGGLSYRERAELDRRYDRLSFQIREERRDRDDRRW
jgi:hypothetical protein